MNQVIMMVKEPPVVQELLKYGAALEAHIGDIISGTNTINDHLLLL